jgi:periplasmic protein TonB
MAFESFLTQDKAKPKKWRRVTYTLSLALHGALLLVGAIYSFWNVDEISPPSVQVTFLAAAPPPPPPPPPPKKKKSEVKPKVPTEIVQPKPNQIYQPKEKPPEPEEEDDGVEGGVEGGVVGGVVGGTVGADLGNTGPVMVAPNVGTGQRKCDMFNDPQFKPRLPPALNRAGMVVWGMFKVCVSNQGVVEKVTIIKPADPLVNDDWMAKLKSCPYRPYSVNGRAVPFCHPVRLEVRSQQ